MWLLDSKGLPGKVNFMSESSGYQWAVGIAADIKPSAAMIIHDNDLMQDV